jgi:hypothetical protein
LGRGLSTGNKDSILALVGAVSIALFLGMFVEGHSGRSYGSKKTRSTTGREIYLTPKHASNVFVPEISFDQLGDGEDHCPRTMSIRLVLNKDWL